jgi:hypothetical protein
MYTNNKKIEELVNNFDRLIDSPVQFVRDCTSVLDEATNPGGELDPRYSDENAQKACNAYGSVSQNIFLPMYFRSSAKDLLVHAWNRFAQIQRKEEQRIYRAGLSMHLANFYIRLGDFGTALRWALLTQADDMLGQHPDGGGEGKNILQTFYGFADETLNILTEIAQDNLQQIRDASEWGWQSSKGFAEDVLRQFFIRSGSLFLGLPVGSVQEYPLCPAYFKVLWKESQQDIAGPSQSAIEKGYAFEDVATYLFLLVPGWMVTRNARDREQTYESDLVISNVRLESNLYSDILGRHFLVECKNRNSRISVDQVGYFLHRMSLTHCKFGVIFAKESVTGKTEQGKETAARSLIRRTYHENNALCVVLAREHLDKLADGTVSFWTTLAYEIDSFRFGESEKKSS